MNTYPLKDTLINLFLHLDKDTFNEIMIDFKYQKRLANKEAIYNIYKIRSSNFPDDTRLTEQFNTLVSNLEKSEEESIIFHSLSSEKNEILFFTDQKEISILGCISFRR